MPHASYLIPHTSYLIPHTLHLIFCTLYHRRCEVLLTAERAKRRAPNAEAPKAGSVAAEAPSAEAPSAEAPSAEAPSAEAPSAEALCRAAALRAVRRLGGPRLRHVAVGGAVVPPGLLDFLRAAFGEGGEGGGAAVVSNGCVTCKV